MMKQIHEWADVNSMVTAEFSGLTNHDQRQKSLPIIEPDWGVQSFAQIIMSYKPEQHYDLFTLTTVSLTGDLWR